ncbi:hypothetical protein AB8U03_15580 [Clostridium sp. Mt-5]|uniref:Uncharacterized protein n=1 Tax=Clostridium moutaii TaxID=3240932 RepID=A0ABV4BVQ7_9CLOT
MKFNGELIRKAHKLTKEIKSEYPEVNYQFQFGLSLKYLLSNKEEGKMGKIEIIINFIEKGIDEITNPAKPDIKKRRLKILQENKNLFKEEDFEQYITLKEGLNKAMEIARYAVSKGKAPKQLYVILHNILFMVGPKMEGIFIEDKKNLVLIKMPKWLAAKKLIREETVCKIEKETEKAVYTSTRIWLPKNQIEIIREF